MRQKVYQKMPGEKFRFSFLEKERAVRILRNSKLIVYDEYRRMLRDIQTYLEEARRSACGGKKKREKDLRPFLYDTGDTYEKPFYSVLTKMLLEINSQKNSQKQAEDLQRVFQWYSTNKKQLCNTEKHFDQLQENSRTLKYRPSSSIDPGGKTGILRHDKVITDQSRAERPQTSFMSLERGPASLSDIAYTESVSAKGIEGVSSPEIPANLNEYMHTISTESKKPEKRPDTAPPYVILDHSPIRKDDVAKSKQLNMQPNQGSDMHVEIQSPVSRVSIHYSSPVERNQTVQVREFEHKLGNSGAWNHVIKSQRSKSANSLQQSVRFKTDLTAFGDLQSEVDEDRVIVDADQIVKNAEINDSQDLDENICDADASLKNGYSKTANSKSGEVLATWQLEEGKMFDNEVEVQAGSSCENRPDENAQEEMFKPKFEYIPSYSKFQQLKERKQYGYKDENGISDEKSMQAEISSQSARSAHRFVAKKQIDQHTGLNQSGLSTASLLQLVTPIGQQMLELKPPCERVIVFAVYIYPGQRERIKTEAEQCKHSVHGN